MGSRLVLGLAIAVCLPAQVIDFESNGLRYKTLTKSGVTVMFAYLPSHVKEYSIFQLSPAGWNCVAGIAGAERGELAAGSRQPPRCGEAGDGIREQPVREYQDAFHQRLRVAAGERTGRRSSVAHQGRRGGVG